MYIWFGQMYTIEIKLQQNENASFEILIPLTKWEGLSIQFLILALLLN